MADTNFEQVLAEIDKERTLLKGRTMGTKVGFLQLLHPEYGISNSLIRITKDSVRNQLHLLDSLDAYMKKVSFYFYAALVSLNKGTNGFSREEIESLQEDFLNRWEYAITRAYKDTSKRGRLEKEIRETFIKNMDIRVETLIYSSIAAANNDDLEKLSNDYMIKHMAWGHYLNREELKKLKHKK